MKDKIRTEVVLEDKHGRTVSRKKEFYPNGKLCSEGLFTCALGKWDWDVPVGDIKKYYPDGILKSEEKYNDSGDRDGDSSFYDPKGKLLHQITYRNGVKIKEQHFDELSLAKERKAQEKAALEDKIQNKK